MRTEPIERPYVAAFDRYSVMANDLDAARAFYGDLLGIANLTTLEGVGNRAHHRLLLLGLRRA